MKSSDLPYVGALLSECFQPELRPYLTYAQPGVVKFLEMRLRHPDSFPENRYCVATGVDRLPVGFAEFRLSATRVGFLSYICVAERARGLGVATSLIEQFVASNASLKRLELDVFQDNFPAIRLYERLGFAEHSQSVWLRRPLPLPSTSLSVSDFRQSAATHAAYGFSELQVKWRGQDVRLGRIGAGVLRCFDPRSFKDNDLLAKSRATFASLTGALSILPAGGANPVPPDATTVALSNRMAMTFCDEAATVMSQNVGGPADAYRSGRRQS